VCNRCGGLVWVGAGQHLAVPRAVQVPYKCNSWLCDCWTLELSYVFATTRSWTGQGILKIACNVTVIMNLLCMIRNIDIIGMDDLVGDGNSWRIKFESLFKLWEASPIETRVTMLSSHLWSEWGREESAAVPPRTMSLAPCRSQLCCYKCWHLLVKQRCSSLCLSKVKIVPSSHHCNLRSHWIA